MQTTIPARIGKEITAIRNSFRFLDRSFRRLVPLLKVAVKNGAADEQPHHRTRVSAKARASLILQGRYMGYMRQLKPKQKAQVRKIKESHGVRAAIARARELTR